MKVLITGSEGFIGSHLVELLVKSGYKVTALTLYNSFNDIGWLKNIDKKVLKKIKIFSGDIRDKSLVDEILKNKDVVINLAALIGIPYSYKSVESYVDTNIKGTMNLLNSAKKYKVKRFIQTSTSEVYGTAKYIPIDEKHPLSGQSPYAASKIASDQLALSYYRSFDLPVTILRPFNTFGPRQSLRAVIPTIISQCLFNDGIVKLGNINTTRDFVFINDTVNAFRLAIKNKNILGEVINIGNNFEISIKEIIKNISQITNKKIKIKIENKRIRAKKSEVYRLYSDNRKAKKILKWKLNYSGINGFRKGLSETINWQLNNRDLILNNDVSDYII
jgi:dTDP-glucose 4,6-dehydratase